MDTYELTEYRALTEAENALIGILQSEWEFANLMNEPERSAQRGAVFGITTAYARHVSQTGGKYEHFREAVLGNKYDQDISKI